MAEHGSYVVVVRVYEALMRSAKSYEECDGGRRVVMMTLFVSIRVSTPRTKLGTISMKHEWDRQHQHRDAAEYATRWSDSEVVEEGCNQRQVISQDIGLV